MERSSSGDLATYRVDELIIIVNYFQLQAISIPYGVVEHTLVSSTFASRFILFLG